MINGLYWALLHIYIYIVFGGYVKIFQSTYFGGCKLMTVFAIITLGFAPGIFWLWFFYKKDKYEPEPRQLIMKMFFWGMVSVIPAIFLEMPFRGSVFLLTVIGAPLVEELVKFMVVRQGVYHHAEFNEPMDGVVYGVAAALGFASAENALYLLDAYFVPGDVLTDADPFSALMTVFILRALLSVPGHALWGAIWGYALGCAKCRPNQKNGTVAGAVLLAMGFHALFNFLLTEAVFMAAGLLILVPVMWRVVNKQIAQALADSPFSPDAIPLEVSDDEEIIS